LITVFATASRDRGQEFSIAAVRLRFSPATLTMYMEQPEGYVDGNIRNVCQLRAIYGLKQGPVQFNKKMGGTLKDIGVIPTQRSMCIHRSSGRRYRVKDLRVKGEATTFAGIEINRRLSQASYVRKLLETFDMSNAKPVSTLMT